MPQGHPIRNIGIVAVCSLLGIWLVFRSMAGESVRIDWSSVRWSLVGLGCLLIGMVWSAKAYRMYIIATGMGERVSFGRFFQIHLATCFLSHITPFNSGGTPSEIYLIHRQGVSAGRAMAITAVDIGLNTAIYIFLVLLSIFYNLDLLGPLILSRVNRADIAWAGVMVIALIGAVGVGWRIRIWRKLPWLRKIYTFLIRKGWFKNVNREWRRFRNGWLILFAKHPGHLAGAVIVTLIYWLAILLVAVCIVIALGHPVDFWYLAGLQLLFNFVQLLIPTPGGSGGSELMMAYFIKPFVGAGQIAVFVLLWRFYTFYASLVLGGICFSRLVIRKAGESI